MGLKLVIVDDAPFIREAMKSIIERSEHQVIGEARDGKEAITVAAQLKPDVIIMDIVMPEKNGIEATIEILQQTPRVKIIACTTIDDKKIIFKALEAGCAEILIKPFEANQLLTLLDKLKENL